MAAKEPANQKDGQKNGKGKMLAEVRALARVLRQYDLAELEVEREGERIRLTRAVSGGPAVLQPPMPASQPGPAETADEPDDGSVAVSSPFVGTFYRAPSPESPPFVDIGQVVSKGTTLCIVEAMKLMNEIEAEVDCKIVEILVKNGESVEFDQALFKVEPA